MCTGDVELKDDVTEEEESETAMLVYDLEKRMCCSFLPAFPDIRRLKKWFKI